MTGNNGCLSLSKKNPEISFSVEATKTKTGNFNHHYCMGIDINLAFSTFKVDSMFSVKDPVQFDLRSCVVYKFLCAGL